MRVGGWYSQRRYCDSMARYLRWEYPQVGHTVGAGRLVSPRRGRSPLHFFSPSPDTITLNEGKGWGEDGGIPSVAARTGVRGVRLFESDPSAINGGMTKQDAEDSAARVAVLPERSTTGEPASSASTSSPVVERSGRTPGQANSWASVGTVPPELLGKRRDRCSTAINSRMRIQRHRPLQRNRNSE